MPLVLIQSIQLTPLTRDAIAKIKLKNLFVVFLKLTPIIPPKVVPKVPKNKPIKVVFNKYSKIKISLSNYLVTVYLIKRFLCFILFSSFLLF